VQFILRTSVSRHFQAFQRGYLSVCEGNALSLFHSEELELLVSGSPESLDVEQLRSITTYEGFRGNEELIESFWEVVHGFSVEQQHKLLTFVVRLSSLFEISSRPCAISS
jgi:E3 ubiquitin-protein ligase HECTD2